MFLNIYSTTTYTVVQRIQKLFESHNQKQLFGDNSMIKQSLAETYPDIAAQWNYEKNKGLKNKFGKDIIVILN